MTKKTKAEQPALFEGAKQETATQSESKMPEQKAEAAPPKQSKKSTRPKQEPGREVAKVERLQVAPPPDGPPNMLSIIASAAANKDVDVSKMRELLAMQKDIMAEQARIAFTEAKVAMRGELPRIRRDGRIEIKDKGGKVIQSTPYATFENMFSAVAPILQKHGFDFYAEPDTGNEHYPIIMRGHLKHVRGHEVTCAIPLPFETSGSKNNVQGIGSSLSYGRRYCLMNLCSIISFAPGDRDDDGASAGPAQDGGGSKVVEAEPLISKEQVKQLQRAVEDSGIPGPRFMDKYQIERLDDLPAGKYAEAMKALADYKAAAQKKAANG